MVVYLFLFPMKRFVKCILELLMQKGMKWRSGKVARYLGFATWILPVHFFKA